MTVADPTAGEATLVILSPVGVVSSVAIPRDGVLIGRSPTADISLNDARVSSFHCRLIRQERRFEVRDLESRNGTWLNDQRVESATLNPGDRLRVGDHQLMLAPGGQVAWGPRSSTESVDLSIELEQIKRSGLEDGRVADDARLSLLWRAGQSMNLLRNPDEVVAATQVLAGQCFTPARVFVIGLPLPEPARWPAGPSRGVVERSLATRSAVLAQQIEFDERFRGRESIVAAGVETVMAVPLLCGREASAVVYVDGQGRAPFSLRDLQLLGLIANQSAAALESASLVAALTRSNQALEAAHGEIVRWSEELERRVEARTEEVRRQADQIRALAEEKDELLGTVAHDIRGPLTAISTLLEDCAESVRAGELALVLDDLGVMAQSARAMSHLLNDLLDVKKVEAGRTALASVPIDVEGFCAKAAALARMQGRASGVTVDVDVAPGLRVSGDPRRLEQALTNLLGNALKFTPAGGTVTVRACALEALVEFSVRDSGPGLGDVDLDTLFDPWTQGEAGKRKVGTGLGLAIARKIVELHGGRIRAERPEGGGACFVFTVPAAPAG
jgi:signal transduction histidine kinase